MRGPLGHGRYLRPATIVLSEKLADPLLMGLVMASNGPFASTNFDPMRTWRAGSLVNGHLV
jgi:hypothetical protein